MLGSLMAFPAHAAGPTPSADELEAGRRIYQEGILPSGASLKGVRAGGAVVGAAAACMSCHRRSGMGAVEGGIQVPPINGRFLFAQREDRVLAIMDTRSGKRMNQAHDPYTDQSLDKAIRRGMNNRGQEMNVVMPRYELGDREAQALIAYLKQLSDQWSPGVTADTIRFATVITPEVEPERRRLLVDMMRSAFVQKNGSTVTSRQAGRRRHMTSAAEMVLGTERTWQLEVWELQGAPETWAGQLDEFYRRQPVFAVVSGLSNSTWEPVHDFCECERVPCWFPSVSLPPVKEQAFYPVYFSRGVTLEADVLAKHLLSGGKPPRRLVQVYRDDYVGRGAAQAMRQSLSGSGVTVEDRVLQGDGPDALRRALADAGEKDSLMFWLRQSDLAMLDQVMPAAGAYFSARLGGGEHGHFPVAWKDSVRLVYPYELPEKRAINLSYFHQWLQLRRIALVDEPLQAEIFFALNFLTDTVAEMLDNLYRDYLLERAESMVSQREGGKAEAEARDRGLLRTAGGAIGRQGGEGTAPLGRHESTTIYPRLSLGQTQRFASKGGYIVRFAGKDDDRLVAESDWLVP
ncbi:c-type cytochrome [Candidatus Ferrigenium straubiae]|uniref:c-type cytochrome n=1 Tax=Candidatus Ferrigenium straubiae TaxID=2919506 RepID=UPI003F4AC801